VAADKILVVDDNDVNLKLIDAVLTGEGYEVHGAGDAREALARVQSVRPRLVLMDLQLPDMDGLEVTRRLKADPASSGVVVVALTAYACRSAW
jgi:two-component system, cell cycle response regulator DivK